MSKKKELQKKVDALQIENEKLKEVLRWSHEKGCHQEEELKRLRADRDVLIRQLEQKDFAYKEALERNADLLIENQTLINLKKGD